MTKLKWHSGPPLHIGWWQASWSRNKGIWRWWDGKQWSDSAEESFSDYMAAYYAERVADEQDAIEWTHYWPKNARVPRIDPRIEK